MARTNEKFSWPVKAVDPPNLSYGQWQWMAVIGCLFLLMGILQLISFADFSNNFAAIGTGSHKWWGALVILAELWATASFFKLRLSPGFRAVSRFWALAVSLFWFYNDVRQLSEGSDLPYFAGGQVHAASANYFGGFLSQQPGWWTVIEAILFLSAVIYGLNISVSGLRLKVTKRLEG
ncbi:MAG TPA: hypothetical protein VFP35_02930 [Candidatus Saccharimonadales bacterium]|nr:hypothetical protein [Candidatus Saccharimonadales bacterium]